VVQPERSRIALKNRDNQDDRFSSDGAPINLGEGAVFLLSAVINHALAAPEHVVDITNLSFVEHGNS